MTFHEWWKQHLDTMHGESQPIDIACVTLAYKAATTAERERCVEVGMNVKDRFVNEANYPAAAAAREVVEAIKALNNA